MNLCSGIPYYILIAIKFKLTTANILKQNYKSALVILLFIADLRGL